MPKGKIIEIITKMLLTLCAERSSELWEGIAAASTARWTSSSALQFTPLQLRFTRFSSL